MYDAERIRRKTSTNSSDKPEPSIFKKRYSDFSAEDYQDLVPSAHKKPPSLQTQKQAAQQIIYKYPEIDTYPQKTARAENAEIQTKLTIGKPGDKYEQEADSVADRVMSMPETPNHEQIHRQGEEEESLQMQPIAASITPLVQREAVPEEELQTQAIQREAAPEDEELQAQAIQRQDVSEEEELQTQAIQRKAAPEEEELQTQAIQREEVPEEELQTQAIQRQDVSEEEELQTQAIQRKKQGNGVQATSSLENRLASKKGGGSSLSHEVRDFMESHFGADFGQVRVHTDSEAIQMNQEVSAHAFTNGNDVYFNAGKYDPDSTEGKRLLAHELTHTIQQSGGGKVQKLVQTQLIQRDEDFDEVAEGKLKEANAPKKLQLPKELEEGLKKAWAGSFPGGKSQEHGGILVKTKDGKYKWKAGKAGNSGSFSSNYGDKSPDETLIGTGHTHPYDKSEGEHTDVSFSGQDLARLVYVEDRIAVVRSGKGKFVAARTEEFDKLLKGLDAAGKKKMFDEMNKLWNDTFSSAKGKFQERAETAVQAVCSKYHLVYYKGEGDKVTKQ